MQQPKKPQNGLTKADNDILIRELEKYANDGASDAELKIFRDEFIAEKKKSTPNDASVSTGPKEKSASPATAGSSGMQTFQGFSKEQQEHLQENTATTEIKERATAKASVLKPFEDRLVYDDTLKQAVPARQKVEKLSQDYKVNTTITDDERAAVAQELEDEIAGKGLWNSIKEAGRSFAGYFTTGAFGAGDALYDERNEIIKANPGKKLTQTELNEQARQLKLDKRLEAVKQSKITSFFRTQMSEDDQNLLFENNVNKLQTLSDKDKTILKQAELQKIEGEQAAEQFEAMSKALTDKRNAGQAVTPQEVAELEKLREAAVSKGQELNKLYNEYLNNKEQIGSLEEEYDVLKRNYSWSDNFFSRMGMSAKQIGLGLLDFTAMGGPGMATAPTTFVYTANQRRKIDEARETLRKDIEEVTSVSDFFDYTSDIVADQLPVLAVTATGAAGLGVLGASSTGEKYSDMYNEVVTGKKSYSPYQMVASSLLHGSAEVVSEIPTLGILKKAGRVMKAPGADDLLKQSFAKKAGAWATDFAADTGKEVGAETFTQVMQNLTKIVVDGDNTVNIQDGVEDVIKDAATLTALLKIAPHVAGRALRPFETREDRTKIDENGKAILALSEKLTNTALQPETRAEIENAVDKFTKQSSDITANTIKKVDELPEKEYKEVLAIEKESAELLEKATAITTDAALDETTREALVSDIRSEYEAKQERKAIILTTVTQPADDTGNNTDNNSGTEGVPATPDDRNRADAAVPQTENTVLNETTPANDTAADGDIRTQPGEMGEVRGETLQNAPEQTAQTATDNRAGETTAKTYRLGATDKAKDYTVAKVNGRLEIKDSQGKEPSAPTRRKLEEVYSEDFDFTQGQRAVDTGEVNYDNYEVDVAEKSQNPVEIAETIFSAQNTDFNESNVSPEQIAIANALKGKIVEPSSFDRFGDRNNRSKAIAGQYFAKKGQGKGLDIIAQEVEYEVYGDYDAANPRITTQDIYEFILDNSGGADKFLNAKKNSVIQTLKEAFTNLTGLPATDKYLQKAIVQQAEKNNFDNNYATGLDYLSDDELTTLANEISQFNAITNEETNDSRAETSPDTTDSGNSESEPGVQETGGPEDSGSQSESGAAETGGVDLAEKLKLQKLRDALNNADDRLSDFMNDTLGVHIPVVVAKVAIKAMKGVVDTAITTADVLSAGFNAIQKTEWYKNLTKGEQTAIANDFQNNFLNRVENMGELTTSFKIQEATPFESLMERMLTKLQDKLLPVRNLQRRIENYTGRKATEDTDFNSAELLMHGKAANDLEQFEQRVTALGKVIADKGLTQEEVSDYLYAKHAKERNAFIRENTDPDNVSGSGMTDEKADEVLAAFDADKKAALKEVAKEVYAIIEDTRKAYERFGLESADNVEILRNQYENYVPLQGFADDELYDSQSNGSGGASLGIAGKIIRRASGRNTKAGNVLANVIAQHTDAVIRGRKNEVMQKLYNFVEENPNTDIWKIFSEDKPDTVKRNVNGVLKNQPVNMQGNDQYVGVKVNGRQFYIKFMNKELGKTLNGANNQKTYLVIQWLMKTNRFLSMFLTSYNPEFVISNFSRDIQTALYNLSSEQDIAENSVKGKKLVQDTLKRVGPAMRAIYRNERGKSPANDELNTYYEEFKADGAKTGWFYAKDNKEISKQIDNIIKLQTGRRFDAATAKAGLKAVTKLVDDANTSVENAIRLATYVTARKSGVDRQDAAVLAKELTVNFNKSGQWGSTINAMYLFFNASIQGTARFAKAMGTLKKTVKDDGTMSYGLNKAQKIAFGMAAFSSALAMLNMAVSDDDEDGESFYKKIPDHVKERNLIIMAPNGRDYYKIPLPYGYNIFSNIGTVATEVAAGERKAMNGAGFMINATVGAFAPVSFSESKSIGSKALKTAAPTVLKPLVDIELNENYFGSTIYNTNFPGAIPKPESSMARSTTPEAFIAMAEFMNQATGGDEFVPGAVDVHPESLQYLYRFFVGGAGRFVDNSVTTAGAAIDKAQGEDAEFETRKIPFVRVVAGEPDPFVNQATYQDRYVEIGQLYNSYKQATDEQRKNEKYNGVVELWRLAKQTEKILKKQRKLKDHFDDEDNEEKRRKGMKKAEEAHNDYISEFNKRYNELRGD